MRPSVREIIPLVAETPHHRKERRGDQMIEDALTVMETTPRSGKLHRLLVETLGALQRPLALVNLAGGISGPQEWNRVVELLRLCPGRIECVGRLLQVPSVGACECEGPKDPASPERGVVG